MAPLEGFTPLDISLEGDGAWSDIKGEDIDWTQATHLAVLTAGTQRGKPSVAIRGRARDGRIVVLETTWNLLYTAAKSIEARYGGAT